MCSLLLAYFLIHVQFCKIMVCFLTMTTSVSIVHFLLLPTLTFLDEISKTSMESYKYHLDKQFRNCLISFYYGIMIRRIREFSLLPLEILKP